MLSAVSESSTVRKKPLARSDLAIQTLSILTNLVIHRPATPSLLRLLGYLEAVAETKRISPLVSYLSTMPFGNCTTAGKRALLITKEQLRVKAGLGRIAELIS